MQIIYTQFYGVKYFCQMQIIFKQFYGTPTCTTTQG